MSFRTQLLLFFVLTIVAAVTMVAWGVSVYTRRAFEDFDRQRTDALVAQFRRESIPRSGCIDQVLTLVIPKYQSVELRAANSVAADDEFLSSIDPHLPPRARALPRLVTACATFRD